MFGSPSALEKTDPAIFALITKEDKRQHSMLEMIASENLASPAVQIAMGSCLTDKYAEGLPGKRYYGGCEHVDEVETLAIERCMQLFGCEHANVQPHSGSQANMAAYFAVIKPGDTVLSMSLAHGGHLTHGSKVSFSGKLYNIVSYGVTRDTETIDYDQMNQLAKAHKPKLIVCGASSYPRAIDFDKIAEIAAANGAKVMADIAHIAGLVCTGLHPNPIDICDVVTTTTHKTLRGPRAGLIMCKKEYADAVDLAVFPGTQGGPLCHIIAAKAVVFAEAVKPEFKVYTKQVLANCQALAEALKNKGFRLCSGGSDNHLVLVDLRPYNQNLTGAAAENCLHDAGIVVNKNMIPFDTRKPTETSGIRIGTPALTTRGLKEDQMRQIAEWIHLALKNIDNKNIIAKIRKETSNLCQQFPIPA